MTPVIKLYDRGRPAYLDLSYFCRPGVHIDGPRRMSRIVLGLLHNYNTFVYSRFFNFNILHSFNNKPRVSLYATPLTPEITVLIHQLACPEFKRRGLFKSTEHRVLS